jgi:uncharacterized OsmC-like protein
MKMSANIKSARDCHETLVETNGATKTLSIAPKANGFGSSVNGGELLLLSLATCFCNDIYREAAKRNITVNSVEVTCTGEFGGEGEPGFNFSYKANVKADASAEEIADLLRHTDQIAEIHNTLRKGMAISLQL